MRACGVGVLQAGQHAGELPEPTLVVEDGEAGGGHPAVLALRDHDVPVGEGSDLRQVRDDHDLGGPGEHREPAPHLDGRLAADPRPLAKGASGGELSRVMLGLEVALAGTNPVPTFVFDEVDAGVGGAAAVEVGRRLAQLARSAQVLVVTHLPQVAAYADRHVVVEKSHDGTVTSSGLTVLDDALRERELSRLLAGQTDSDTGLAHARELLDVAQPARALG